MYSTAFEIPKFVGKATKKYLVKYSVDVYVDSVDEDNAVEDAFQLAQTEFEKKCYAKVEEIKQRK